MAYLTGSASGAHDLLDKFRAFLVTNGWTVNKYEAVGTGYRLHVNKGSLYLNFRSVQGEVISISDFINGVGSVASQYCISGYLSDGYNGSMPWNDQPGKCQYVDGRAQGGSLPGLNSTINYHFFAYADSDEVFMVAEFSPSKYLLFTAGTLKKYTPAAFGGRWISFPARSGLLNVELPYSEGMNGTYAASMIPFRAGDYTSQVSSVSSYIRVNVDDTDGYAGEGSTSPYTPLLGAACQSCWDNSAVEQGASPYLWQAPLMPYAIMIARPSQIAFSPFGEIRNLRRLAITNYQPAEEFSLGSDTWKVFPLYQKGGYSGQLGYAIKKVV